jgi:hypothetical protein
MKKQSDSDFDVNCVTVQFYRNSHNSQFDNRIEILRGVSSHVFLPWIKILGQSKSRKALQYWSTKGVQILLFTFFWLVDFLLGSDVFSTRMW